MKKLSQAAAVISLGIACAMPVMAQSSGSGTATTPSATTVQSTDTTKPSTATMGAGPSDTPTVTRVEHNDRDLGWIGLLGLAGLLGLRRKKHDDNRHDVRTAHPMR